MRRIGFMLLTMLALAACALGKTEEVTYRDYGGKLTVPADAAYIDLGKMKVSNYDVFEDFLDSLPQLEKVDMYLTHVFRKQADRLSSRYPHIEFGWTLYFGDHTIRTDQTAFSTLHDGVMRRHTSEDLSVLRYCRNLRALDLGHNALTDISFLSELRELRLLILADNQIEDLSPLSGLSNLEYIELFDNRVADLSPLGQLNHLMDLNIAQNRVRSLEPLHSMTWLQRLWLGVCSKEEGVMTPETLEALSASLANTQIDAVSLGTDGGWRDHPHYDILFKMFKGKDYLPFEDSYPAAQSLRGPRGGYTKGENHEKNDLPASVLSRAHALVRAGRGQCVRSAAGYRLPQLSSRSGRFYGNDIFG